MTDPRARAAAALRRMGHAMMGHEADPELLRRVAEAASRVADDLEQEPLRDRDPVDMKRRMYHQLAEDGAPMSHFPECFVSGAQNPMGIAIDVRRDGDEVVAEVELGVAFEGAPARAHGGIVAAIFDDVQGYLLTLIGTPAFTGELTVRYLAPTPIHQTLVFRGRVAGRDGRKIHTRAEAQADGSLVATSHAVFVAVDPERIRG